MLYHFVVKRPAFYRGTCAADGERTKGQRRSVAPLAGPKNGGAHLWSWTWHGSRVVAWLTSRGIARSVKAKKCSASQQQNTSCLKRGSAHLLLAAWMHHNSTKCRLHWSWYSPAAVAGDHDKKRCPWNRPCVERTMNESACTMNDALTQLIGSDVVRIHPNVLRCSTVMWPVGLTEAWNIQGAASTFTVQSYCWNRWSSSTTCFHARRKTGTLYLSVKLC